MRHGNITTTDYDHGVLIHNLIATTRGAGAEWKPPQWLADFWDRFHCTLIEEQRLIKMDYEGQHRTPKIRRVVGDFSEHIKGMFRDVMGKYGERSQQLERSFPQRMVGVLSSPAQSVNELRAQINTVGERRELLQQADLLGGEAESGMLTPDNESLGREDVRRLLSLYVQDMSNKLSVFDDLYSRLSLFGKLIGGYFTDKAVKLSKQGIEITTSTGSKLSADALSSGEQHILVLFFRLLFGHIGRNHLVMIDEPELSLHARWQIRFISDLLTIRQITTADFLLASHSPLIFQGHWDLSRDLKS
jgi:hypothetical protein